MSFENIIKDYLVKKASSDAVFAEKFHERMNKEGDKVIDGCCSYIKNQARKEAQRGCAVIEDAKVFGWAMHYCVFRNGYYKKEGILILSARRAGVRLETIEVDTTRWKIIQCRGRFNQDSSHHKAIMNLMEKNMNKLRMAN